MSDTADIAWTNPFTGDITSLGSYPIIASPSIIEDNRLRDGLIIATPDTWFIGTRPLTDEEAFLRSIRLRVRTGLADVLTQLGQPVNNEGSGADWLRNARGSS